MIRLSDHAKDMLMLRGITLKQIEQTIRSPDRTENGKNNTTMLYKQFGLLYLRTIIKMYTETTVVITAHWINQKRMKGEA